MLVRLDHRSDLPIYVQIAESIAGQIESGALKAGHRLPSARALGETLGVNMHTVLKAYSELEGRGQVRMRRGRGGVVVQAEDDLSSLARKLVDAAKRRGWSRRRMLDLIEEVW